jgi:hypothetical protein
MTEEYKDTQDPFRKWGLIILGGIVILCLLALVSIFIARKQLATTLIRALASETSTSTATLPETATFTFSPTEAATQEPLLVDTSVSTPNRAPAMEIMTQIQGPPLLDEKFLDNSKSWTGLGQNSEFLIQENELQLHSTDPEKPGIIYCSGQCGPYDDNYYYQVELVEDRASSFGIGLAFALDPQNSTLFNFVLKPSSMAFSLTRLKNGVWENLIDWTPSKEILPFPQPNILGVSIQKEMVQLYINGTRDGNFTQNGLSGYGRIGMFVERDGVRLIAKQALVYQLTPFSAAAATSLIPTSDAAATSLIPASASPTLLVKYTSTPTVVGTCPREVPKGTWALVVTKISQSKGSIKINGVENKVEMGGNVFYLQLNTSYVINVGGKSYEYKVLTCKIVYLKMK